MVLHFGVPRDDVKHSPEWEGASVVFGDHGEVFGRLSYFELIGKLGSILTGVSPDEIRSAAIECQKRALSAKDEEGDLESSGIRFECQAFTRAGGGTAMIFARPTK